MKKIIWCILSLSFSFFSTTEAQSRFWIQNVPSTVVPNVGTFKYVQEYSSFQLNHDAFREFLKNNCPLEHTTRGIPVLLPFPDGSLKEFVMHESPCMEKELMEKYPEIRSYKGQSGPYSVRLSISPFSFYAFILGPEGDIIIESLQHGKTEHYGIYFATSLQIKDFGNSLVCGTQDLSPKVAENNIGNQSSPGFFAVAGTPVELRTFRVAIACTGEWGAAANLGGGTIEKCLDKINASLVYINGVMEKENAIHFNLVGGNDKLIFLDPDADLYFDPTSGGQTLGVNTDIINRRIGNATYDFGHVYTIRCTDVGGIASLGSVCGGGKGAGVTCWYTPDIAYVSLRIVCHEMGHQFSASHTFSNCNGNEAGTSFEPGSGSTIMSYSGLCGDDLNVQANNEPHPNYYHVNSLERIYTFVRGPGSTGLCGSTTISGNHYPVAEILNPIGLTLPYRTPFILKGKGTDMDNDPLTYNWEQYDAGGYGGALGQPTENGPLIRSVFPGTNPDRVIPNWTAILTNQNFLKTELLPSNSRKLTFRFTVRDNHPGAGGSVWEELKMDVTDAAGPFRVTSPNGGEDLYKNSCVKITWDVANTHLDPVNCKRVNIVLYRNRDLLNPIPLKTDTENDGEELVTIPDLADDTRSRIKVEAADHIFFDVSDFDVKIKSTSPPSSFFAVSPNKQQVCVPSLYDVNVQSCSNGSLTGNLQLFVKSGLPVGAKYSFEKDNISLSESTPLHLDFTEVKTSGIYNVAIGGVNTNGDTIIDEIEFDLVSIDFSGQALIYPPDGLSGAKESFDFTWQPSVNAFTYNFELATSPSFGSTVVYSAKGLLTNTLRVPFLLNENTLYYWRIIPVNRCGEGDATLPNAFHTISRSCNTTVYTGNTVTVTKNMTGNMSINIPSSGNISDVNIRNLDASAQGVNSIKMTLISPAGTKILVWNYNCTLSDAFKCSFDDEGLVRAAVACPPTNDKIIIPIQALKTLNGEDRKGLWQLEVTADTRLTGGAKFYSFGLDICSDIALNIPTLINNNPLSVNLGETKGIGNPLLQCTDQDNTPQELKYTLVTKPLHGNLHLNGQNLVIGSQFTQKDIDDGKFEYAQNGISGKEDGFYFTVIDGKGGWIGTFYFKINITGVGTKNITKLLDFNVYPNPAVTENVRIEMNSNSHASYSITLFDLQGKIKQTKININGPVSMLDIESLAPGIYFVELRQANEIRVKKIIVQ